MKLVYTGLIVGLLFFTSITAAMDDGVAKAEQFWKNRRDQKMVDMAITALETTVAKDSMNYEALWRLGRYYQFLGDCSNNKKLKLHFYQKGLRYAERAVKANSQGSDGHLQYAVLLGCVSLEKSVIKGFSKLQIIRDELNIALRIDPLNARAHNTLALLYWKIPGKPISFGDKKTAQEEATLAVKYDSKVVYYWLILGQIADANKDFSTARMALNKVLELPADPEDPIDAYYKDWAGKELSKIPMV